jgi:alpha-ketoglutarate-dependent taurine dioxygenase
MKVSKMPGCGRFGIYIDDVDFNNLTDEEWIEIGKLHVENLVTVIRNTNMPLDKYQGWMGKWGVPRFSVQAELVKAYPQGSEWIFEQVMKDSDLVREDHKTYLRKALRTIHDGQIVRVSGRVDKVDGASIGLFGSGDLGWHSNEGGRLHFSPAVSLLSGDNMIGSATGWLTTTDWYEQQSESLRSELNEMVLLHRFDMETLNPGGSRDLTLLYYHNSGCGDGESEVPLVVQSPGGHMGIHLSLEKLGRIKGMSDADSDKFISWLWNELHQKEYIYDHWYTEGQQDLCLFDNSVVMHRRQGGVNPNRLAYRIQYDYTYLQEAAWQPYVQPYYAEKYKQEITEIVNLLGITDFKLPK